MRKLQAIGKAVRYQDTGQLVAKCEDTGAAHVLDNSGAVCARLFAAAPDLLDALRAILFQSMQGPVLERDACIAQARAAYLRAIPQPNPDTEPNR